MFNSLEPIKADPILGLLALYREDTNTRKMDLGIGIYKDESGETPVMSAVKKAEALILDSQKSKSYVAPTGSASFNSAIAELLLGKEINDSLGPRRATIQAPGGCGGLRLSAEFIKQANSNATIWVSDPTWANHIPLMKNTGLKFATYPYYDHSKHSVKFDEMISCLRTIPKGDVVLLHGCCHNPCGADLTQSQWHEVNEAALTCGFTVLIDLAYQGLGDGLEEDVFGVRLLAKTLPELIVVSSCSKNFGLYRERVGAMTLITDHPGKTEIATSVIAASARAMYSMPPDHGAEVVQLILNTPALRDDWSTELAEMRNRINGLRIKLVERIHASDINEDYSFIQEEKGMFSFLGIGVSQVQALVKKHSVYLVDSSRINVAGISNGNIEHFVNSLSAVKA